MIRMGWMTDSSRVIGSTSMMANMWRIFRMPPGLKPVMETEIYDAEAYAAGPMMRDMAAARGKPVYALTRDPSFNPSRPNIIQCSDAEALGKRFAKSEDELLVIGGNGVFELLLPYASRLHIAETTKQFPGNVIFDSWESAPGFTLVAEENWKGGRTLQYSRPLEFLKN